MDELKGKTFIPNNVLEKLYSLKLNGTQLSIILTVCRFTYGFQREKHLLSANFISQATNINIRNIKRELDKLTNRKIILTTAAGKGKANAIQINSNIHEWGVANTPVVISPPVVNRPLPVVVNTPPQVVANSPPKKEKEIKIKKEKYIVIFTFWNQQKIIVHQKLDNEMEKAIDDALKKYDEQTIRAAISHYAQVQRDPDYFFDYSWTLIKFLKQKNALPEFVDGGQKWISYQNFKNKSKVKKDDVLFEGEFGEVEYR